MDISPTGPEFSGPPPRWGGLALIDVLVEPQSLEMNSLK